MGRSHDYYCVVSRFAWSPFNCDECPEHKTELCSVYDLNYDAEESGDAAERRDDLLRLAQHLEAGEARA